MALTPNQIALLPIPQRIFGQQPVAGYNKERFTAFICYGCIDDNFYRTAGTYPHFKSMELIPNKITGDSNG